MLRYIAVFFMLFNFQVSAADNGLKDEKDRLSYTLGVQVGKDFKQRGFDVNVDAFSKAIKDTLADSELKLTEQEMAIELKNFQQKQMDERMELGEKKKQASEDFLAKNKQDPAVVTFDSGVQYKVIKQGTGKSPLKTDTVVVHYRGTLIDGKEFDSSIKRGQPSSFPVGGVIKGWQEVLQNMKVGAKWHAFIPSDLAYGARGAGADIGPNEALIFEIELLEIK